MNYTFGFTPLYTGCLRDYATDARAQADLNEALVELARQPFNNPALQTHHMKGVSGPDKTFISYVGNRGHRLIWRLLDRTIVLLLFGAHDAVERRAERIDFQIDEAGDGVRIMEYDRVTEPSRPPAVPADEFPPGRLFMGWTDGELTAMGFTDTETAVLRRLDTEDGLLGLEGDMAPASFQRALNLYLYQNPDGEQAVKERVDATASAAHVHSIAEGVDPTVRELERKLRTPASRQHFAVVERDDFAEVLSKPIEDWMVFLHPDQARLTQRPYSGPARVRGAAGTGKTVVALHRARHLAEIYGGPVLFTTYVRNLPVVYEQLFRRLAPEAAAAVEFANLHKWAHRFVKAHGSPFKLDPGQVDEAWWEAWRRTTGRDDYLASTGYGPGYYRQELDWVVKGRDLRTLDDYLALARTGRGTALGPAHRRKVWELYEEYGRQLARRGVVDFNDLLIRALELVRSGRLRDPYRAVVVDEAQDLTEVGIRLCHALAGGDARDGLFIVGDGQQAVYPGGFSLAQVGIEVRGRSHVLTTNYRNTRQILEAALAIVAEGDFDDLDEVARGRRDVTCLRDGEPPAFAGFDRRDDHDEALVLALQEAADNPAVGPGDLAVLVPTNRLVAEYTGVVSGLGLATQKLQQYDGRPNDLVKVGTYQRAKGLEFKQVFLPRLEPDSLGETRRHNEDEETYRERLELLRRQLFVAMTRARDRLCGGWVGEPPALVAQLGNARPATAVPQGGRQS